MLDDAKGKIGLEPPVDPSESEVLQVSSEVNDGGGRMKLESIGHIIWLHSPNAFSAFMWLFLYLRWNRFEPIVPTCPAGTPFVPHLFFFIILSVCCYLFTILGCFYIKYTVMSYQLQLTVIFVLEIIAIFGLGFLMIATGCIFCSRDTYVVLKVVICLLTPLWLFLLAFTVGRFFRPISHDRLPPKQQQLPSPSASSSV